MIAVLLRQLFLVVLLCETVFSQTACPDYQLCKKDQFPWKRHVAFYGRPCSGEFISNTTVSPVFEAESFLQLKTNYFASLMGLSMQIQNLTFHALSWMPPNTNRSGRRVITKKGKRCKSNSVLLKSFEELTEIGLFMNFISQHLSVVMNFHWNENHLLNAMCNLRKIYHRHGEDDGHSNASFHSAATHSLCIKHTADCDKIFIWLQDKLQNMNNKIDRVFQLYRRFVRHGQYHVP